MFRSNIQQYRLFIWCNVASVGILYSFISISVNNSFKDPSLVDPMISSNIYAPTVLVILFSGLFIPYTHKVFMKVRSKDYGILLTLGMTSNEVRNHVLLENMALCILFLISGLGLGTLLSLFFWVVIRYGIGIKDIPISVSMVSYKVTSLYVTGVFVLSLLVNLLGILKSTILDKIKYTQKTESGRYSSVWSCMAGLGLTIFSFMVMMLLYHNHSNIWFLSLFFCVLGSFLILFNGEALIEYYKKKNPQSYIKHLFLISDMKYYYRKNRMLFFVTTWIFFAVLFFMMFSLVTYPNFKSNAVTYHPFHMAYADVKGSYQPLKEDVIEQIAEQHSNSILRNDHVKFVRNNLYTIFDIEDINKEFMKDYTVEQGSMIYVYPYDTNDGYEHVVDGNLASIQIGSHKGTKSFTMQETLMNPLFGQINCISDRILLVNSQDYEWIVTQSDDYRINGILYLYDFADWRKSEEIIDEVSNKLQEMNGIDKGDRFYQVSSRIEAYDTALQSSNFLMFIMLYACLLLYFSALTMIHFKLKMESQDDVKKYLSLHRIGLLEDELRTMVRQKIRVIFLAPVGYAGVITIAYSYYINSTYGYGVTGIFSALLTTVVFLVIHFIVYRRYVLISYKQANARLSLSKNRTTIRTVN